MTKMWYIMIQRGDILKVFKELFRIISSKQITQTLLNLLILLLIVLLMSTTSDVWGGFIHVLWQVIKPFFIAFVIAFFLNPLITWVERYVKKRGIALAIVYMSCFAVIILIIALAIPVVYNSIFELYPAFEDGLIYISKLIEENLHFNISHLVAYIQKQVASLLKTTTVLNTTFGVLNSVVVNVANFLIYLILAIYISSRYSNLCKKIKYLSTKFDESLPIYLTEINSSLIDYLKAFSISAVVQAFTTCIIYLAVGHSNWALIGIISGISSIIPYVGPIVANLLGIITSLTMGPTRLFILLILIFIQSNIVPYVIQPKIYSSKIDLSILWVLFGILAGSTLFGPWGMVIAMPLLVTCKITYRVYRLHHPVGQNA